MPACRLRTIWKGMIARCENARLDEYKNYGLRGIKVCHDWRSSFDSFKKWAISCGYKDNLSLDRFPDNNGNYEPGNCRWATRSQQARNTRRNISLTAFGEKKVLKDWANDSRCLVSYQTLLYRINSGWDIANAMVRSTKNARRKSIIVTAFGESKTAKQWSRDSRCKVTYRTLVKRLRRGHAPEYAMSTQSGNIAKLRSVVSDSRKR